MQFIDTNIFIFLLKNKRVLENYTNDFLVTEDIKEEIELSKEFFPVKNPANIQYRDIFELNNSFDKASYYRNYHYVLNNYSLLSLYNMKGLGDVSIVAMVKTLEEKNVGSLFGKQELVIFTDDGPLIRVLQKEFKGSEHIKIVNPIKNLDILL